MNVEAEEVEGVTIWFPVYSARRRGINTWLSNYKTSPSATSVKALQQATQKQHETLTFAFKIVGDFSKTFPKKNKSQVMPSKRRGVTTRR